MCLKKPSPFSFCSHFLGAAHFRLFHLPAHEGGNPDQQQSAPFPLRARAQPQRPESVPLPEPSPNPNTPKVPPGPTLRVMAWAYGRRGEGAGGGSRRLWNGHRQARLADHRRRRGQLSPRFEAGHRLRFAARCVPGHRARFFRASIRTAIWPTRHPLPASSAPRSLAAFTVDGHLKAVPDECSVDVLFYNPRVFRPGRHRLSRPALELGHPGGGRARAGNRSTSRTPRASRSIRSSCPPISISGTSSAPRRAIRRSTSTSGTWRTSTRRNRRCARSISSTRFSRDSASRRHCRKQAGRRGGISRNNTRRF